jgi:hypothetical protein
MALPLTPATPNASAIVIATDASEGMWGAELAVEGSPRPPPLTAPVVSKWTSIKTRLHPHLRHLSLREVVQRARCSRPWPRHLNVHVTHLETLAASLAVQHLASLFDLREATVVVLTDATACKATFQKRGSMRPSLATAYEPALRLQLRTGCTILAAHIAGTSNVWSDLESRRWQQRLREPLLNPITTARVAPEWRKWVQAHHTVDLFADPHSALLPQFVSFNGAPPALMADALSSDWLRLARRGPLWVFPPTPLLHQVATRVASLHPLPQLTVLTPHKPHKSWWRALQRVTGLQARTAPALFVVTEAGEPLAHPSMWTLWSSLPLSA